MSNRNVLVALLRDKKDFTILKTEGWYRIPIDHTPKRWPPDIIGFYQPSAFGKDAFLIRYFGEVVKIEKVERRCLFPNEFESSLSNKLYHRIQIEQLTEHPNPISCRLPRVVVFISTTWPKFIQAEELNDLYDDSPLEDTLWDELKRQKIPAERQWPIFPEDLSYRLDFAFFCNRGNLDVETDGDTYHVGVEQGTRDNLRNNNVESLGWHVMRFNTKQIQEQCKEYCLPKIQNGITSLGGLVDDGMVPRKFINKGGLSAQQLTLFEEKASYEVEPRLDDFD
jgi:very-short-patch-repair endonuclease